MLRDEAKRYFDSGLNVVLLRDKKPLHRWQHLFNERQTEEEFNALPWEEANQFAVLCGKKAKNGLYLGAIDIDVKNLPAEVAEKALTIMRSFPTTQTEKTPSGGYHLVFWSVKPVKTISQYHNVCGVELIGEGKLCIMYPSEGYFKVNDNLPSEVDDLTGLFFEVLAEHGIIPQKAADEPDELLERWLRQIKAKLKVKSEGARYISCSCPFHPPDRHPSFAINKQRYYAVDYHTGEVYNLKELAEKLGITLERGISIIKDLEEIVKGDFTQFFDDGKFVPKRLGDYILEKYHIFTHRYSDEIYVYQNGVWKPKGETIIAREVKEALGERFKQHYLNEVISYVKASTYCVPKEPPVHLINLKNGIYDLETDTLEPHSPEYFFFNQLPVEYDPEADCPKIKKFLKEVAASEEDVDVLEEIAGYCLYRSYPIHKALMLVGEETNRFATAALFGKLANIYPDLSDKSLTQTGIFKMLTGGDLIEAEKKFKDSFKFVNYAKLLFSCNKLPSTFDDTEAFFRRWIILTFPNKFEPSYTRRNNNA